MLFLPLHRTGAEDLFCAQRQSLLRYRHFWMRFETLWGQRADTTRLSILYSKGICFQFLTPTQSSNRLFVCIFLLFRALQKQIRKPMNQRIKSLMKSHRKSREQIPIRLKAFQKLMTWLKTRKRTIFWPILLIRAQDTQDSWPLLSDMNKLETNKSDFHFVSRFLLYLSNNLHELHGMALIIRNVV